MFAAIRTARHKLLRPKARHFGAKGLASRSRIGRVQPCSDLAAWLAVSGSGDPTLGGRGTNDAAPQAHANGEGIEQALFLRITQSRLTEEAARLAWLANHGQDEV